MTIRSSLLLTAAACLAATGARAAEPAALKEAKLNIEYNATADDTGFQGFIDSEGWQSLTVTGPNGPILHFEGLGTLAGHGLTELFFETVEPAAADMSVKDVLSLLPAGDYMIEGPAIEEAGTGGRMTRGVAHLTHDIPAGPELLSPAAESVVAAGKLNVSWSPVRQTIAGGPVDIIAYQLIIERDEDPHPNMIGKYGLSMYLPAGVTSIDIPDGFLQASTAYVWEVLAIEQSGNQTLSSGAFRTE